MAAGGAGFAAGGGVGDCASAVDTISAPTAMPIIGFFIMDRLLGRAREPCALSFERPMAAAWGNRRRKGRFRELCGYAQERLCGFCMARRGLRRRRHAALQSGAPATNP
jgi:hypothetical protein